MTDSPYKIYFVYTPAGVENPEPPSTEKHDEEKGLDETFSEVIGVLRDDGFHWCHGNLGDGACSDDYENLECRLDVWDVQTRNQRLEELELGADDMLISDIYEINAKHLVLHPDVSINVPVSIPQSYVPTKDMYNFYFKVMQDGEWNMVHATYKYGCARAHLDALQLLTVIAKLKPETTSVTPEGAQFVSDKDPDVKVEIPKDAVDTVVDFKFVTETVDQKRSSSYRSYNPDTFQSIVGFSTTINVDHDLKGHFNKEVKVTLPIHECGDDDGESEVVFLRWHGDEVEIVDTIPTKTDGCYCIDVRGFSAYSALRVRSASISRSEIMTAARFLSGRENLCTLMCFLNFKVLANMPMLLIDVVESCRADRVAEEHKQSGWDEIAMSRSRDLPVPDRERIKLEFGGDLSYAPGIPRHAYNLVFIKAAKKNHVTFPLKVKVSSTPFSIITFQGHLAKWSHRVHFNVNRGPKHVKNLLTKPKGGTTRRGSLGSNYQSGSESDASLSPTRKSRSSSAGLFCRSYDSGGVQQLVSCVSLSSSETWDSIRSSRSSLSSISEDGVFEDKRHPTLCEKSLLVLSEQLPWSEWQKVAIELGMTLTQVERTAEEAVSKQISPAFRILLRWIAFNKLRVDRDLVNDLACAFRELGRNDLADVVMEAEKTRLPLRRRDFT